MALIPPGVALPAPGVALPAPSVVLSLPGVALCLLKLYHVIPWLAHSLHGAVQSSALSSGTRDPSYAGTL